MKKVVFIDTNMINDDGSYFVSDIIIRHNGYMVGDIVTAYQDQDVWKAKIVNTDGAWGVELLSETELISDERYEGHQEGFAYGVYIQSLKAIRILQNLNVPAELIETMKKKLNLV